MTRIIRLHERRTAPPTFPVPAEAYSIGDSLLLTRSLTRDSWRTVGLFTGAIETASFTGANTENVVTTAGLPANVVGITIAVFDGGTNVSTIVTSGEIRKGVPVTGSTFGDCSGTGVPVLPNIGPIVEISSGTSWGAETWVRRLLEDYGSSVTRDDGSRVTGIDLEWLVTEPESAATPEKLRLLYRGLQYRLRRNEYEAVDSIFKRGNIRLLPAEALIAMLRYSFAAHKRLEA